MLSFQIRAFRLSGFCSGLVIVAAALGLLPGCGGGGQGSAARTIPASKIAFMSKRDGASHIYIMNSDGSGQHRLTNRPSYGPALSLDGSKIAFSQGNNIFLMNADGTEQQALTHIPDEPGVDSGAGGASFESRWQRGCFRCQRTLQQCHLRYAD
ncbi:MAG: PD40 domain-containing protein [Abitibacteriaceae bacterium]|nr:PD40 domain-containing protein [Abditibacteriaceae bacterium]